jgi:hypothetical protein
MNKRPGVLDQLGAELDRVASRQLARSRRLPLAPRRLSAMAVLVGLLMLAAAAAAAVLLIQQGAPLPAPHAQDLQASGVPLAGSARLAGLDAPDPEQGAPAWDIRLSRTRSGETCTAVGQVFDGQFGIVGLDHVFRAIPLGGGDACGVSSPTGPMLAGARVFVGNASGEARTVVNGVAGAGARSVTAYGPGGARALRLGPQGSFITVYRGYVEDVRPRVVVVGRDGRTHSIAFARSAAFEAPDPSGSSPWEVSAEADLERGAYPDESCAQASQEPGRVDPSRFDTSLTPQVCGRLGTRPLFVSIRRFVPGSGEHTGWPWGNNPARTIVYGAAAPRVASLTLTGPGISRKVAIDAHGGAFAVVLDGHVDPRSLTLAALLRDGSKRAFTHSTGLLEYINNWPQPELPVPAYRDPLPASQSLPPPFELPIADTVRETLRASDPAGGSPWAVRSWQALPNPRANFGGTAPHRFLCAQLGVLNGGQLAEPRPGAAARPLAVGQEMGQGGARCNEAKDLRRMRYMLDMETYLGDLDAYAPSPSRTVLSGMLPPGARDARLLGVGPARPLALDANDAFLVVLPGRYWQASPHITYRLDGRTVGAGASPHFPLGPGPFSPQARAPDPDGGAPWGFAATADCATAVGRIVEGRLVSIDPRSGVLKSGPSITGSGGGCPTHPLPFEPPGARRQPVLFDIQQEDEQQSPPSSTPSPLTRPQIERRSLPGRTIITGLARADAVSITLSTPQDVRTLRPAGPMHAVIAVYDGQFFRGALSATITLRDGRTVTQMVPNGASSLPAQSLATRLRSARQQLAGERRHPHRLPRFAPPTPLTAIIGVIERRIAYQRAHPGLLPPE